MSPIRWTRQEEGMRISELFPVLERELISLRNQEFTDFIFTVSYLVDKIIAYFGNGEKWGVNYRIFCRRKSFRKCRSVIFSEG